MFRTTNCIFSTYIKLVRELVKSKLSLCVQTFLFLTILEDKYATNVYSNVFWITNFIIPSYVKLVRELVGMKSKLSLCVGSNILFVLQLKRKYAVGKYEFGIPESLIRHHVTSCITCIVNNTNTTTNKDNTTTNIDSNNSYNCIDISTNDNQNADNTNNHNNSNIKTNNTTDNHGHNRDLRPSTPSFGILHNQPNDGSSPADVTNQPNDDSNIGKSSKYFPWGPEL